MNIYSFNKEKLAEILTANGFKKFNATQIFEWLYLHKVTSFNEMTNLSKVLVAFLNEAFTFKKVTVIDHQHDQDVDKFLIELADHNTIECVLMHQQYGISICLSTQVGCNMNCSFCASGKLGKIRNLTPEEMVTPILVIEQMLNIRISHVVFMGIGEPFDNYDNLLTTISIMNDAKGLAIGARHITVSTSGIVPKIEAFSTLPLQVNLAVSLHAPTNELRNKLMPINKVYNVEQLIEVCKKYIKNTNRRITIEYVMLKDINDHEAEAIKLAALIKGMNVYVNLIPYNSTDGNYQKSSEQQMMLFYDILKKSKINVIIRREFGGKIDAACGQLRVRNEECK